MWRRLLCLGGLLMMVSNCLDDSFDETVGRFMKASNLPGISIVVSRKGKIIFANGYGYADLENRVPMRADTAHELASLSKQFTAACILLLHQDGRLGLEDRLSKFFPDATLSWHKITIRQLLNHTSGLPEYLDQVNDLRREYTPDQLVGLIRAKALMFKPGSEFEYCNTNYMLLGFIVEKVSGMDLGLFLRERVLRPAHMRESGLNDGRTLMPNRAVGYRLSLGKLVRPQPTSRSLSMTGDGEVVSSALDLAKWDAILYRSSLLNAESKREMFTPSRVSVTVENGESQGYGCGYSIIEAGGKIYHEHYGGWVGTSTSMTRYVSDGLCVVVLANRGRVDLEGLNKAIHDRFLPLR